MPQVAEKNTVEVKTITTKRVPAGETENGSDNEPRIPWDEYLLDLSSTDWLHHEVRVYRREPAAMRGLLGVFQEPINESYLMKNYGGGEYWITIKRNGKSDKYVCEKVQISGEPKRDLAVQRKW